MVRADDFVNAPIAQLRFGGFVVDWRENTKWQTSNIKPAGG
jgi:hypothetical protein